MYWAAAELVLALLAQKKQPAAQTEIRHAKVILPPGASYPNRFSVALSEARLKGRWQRRARAQAGQQVLADAHRHGFVVTDSEARLLLAEIESRSDRDKGAAQLDQLSADAQHGNFLLLAL